VGDADPRAPLHRGRRATALLVAISVVVVSLAVTATVLLRAVGRHDAESDRRLAAVTAARQAAVNFTTIDYRTLDRDLARVADGATGDFRREFTDQATSKEFTDRVRTTKVVSTGEVLDAAVADLSEDRAIVLVIADSTVTNSSLPAPGAVRHVRLRLTMTLVRDRWLVSDLAPAA
jgi:Mce-associated membrane protein